MIQATIKQSLQKQVPAVSLAFFRIAFGLMMAAGAVRFILKGWVYDLYVAPEYFFTYYGFEFVKPLPEWGMYVLFGIIILSALMVAAGLFYRTAIIVFLLSFTYVELIDKTTYLNHYYFITLMAFLMAFLPMNATWSLDALRRSAIKRFTVPQWTLVAIKVQIAIVYFFGGIAKLKPDWLLEAQPLKIWLSANAGIPIIGPLLEQEWMAYGFSWAGMLFDLSVPFLLINRRTRIYALAAIVFFHVMTAKLFYIGMFPYIMMLSVLVFFPAHLHQRWLSAAARLFRLHKLYTFITDKNTGIQEARPLYRATFAPLFAGIISVFFLYQTIMPFRYVLYPNNLCWSEEGYRYSWNIMLMEKNAYTEFNVTDPVTGRNWLVSPDEHLTRFQSKQMSTQPDMILQFAHYLRDIYSNKTGHAVEVRAESYASMNGRPSRLLIDPDTDLAKKEDRLTPKNWILPLEPSEKIYTVENR